MSDAQFPQNEENKEINQNNQQENQTNISNHSNKDLDKNNNINKEEKNEELKIGKYILTPLESIIINKKMPFGFKLETEENILKSVDSSKNQTKKYKNATKHKEKIIKETNRNGGIKQMKKRNQNNVDNIPSNISPEIYKINKNCKKGIEKLKESKYVDIYYQSNNPDIPCIANIEKKVNNYEYKNLYDFKMDVRKIWSSYFKSKEHYEMTSKMSDLWEKICEELENGENQNNEMSVNNIKKRTEKIQEELSRYRDNGANRENLQDPAKKNNQQNNEHNKAMTVEEKNKLGNNIRSLNKEQLRGIIKILSDNNSVPRTKYFEFDIDKLSVKKLRELDKYVKECLASTNKNNKNQGGNNTNNVTHSATNVNNNKTQKEKETQNNKSNNKGNNNQKEKETNLLKSNSKEPNKGQQEGKNEQTSGKKIKQSNKKSEVKKNESFSESESLSSDSSLSNY